MRPALRRAVNSVVPLALTVLIVAPVIPGPVGSAIASRLRVIGVVQSWNMYAPDPQRSHTYLSLSAELADGSIVPLDEAEQAERGWGAIWDWEKRRTDIWRYYAVLRPEEQNVNRTWYLRSVCVREARTREAPPVAILAERVRRRFTPPDEVAAGAPGLGAPSRSPMGKVRCADWPERAMIAADRVRRGLPTEDPRPTPATRPRRRAPTG